ncbi:MULTISPECIES: 3-hydroxyacyl-CoA dehydrogenase [Terrabacteria group]|uniref:3-hydroxyacyl-CoA dehydrogenase n=1 Tax=Bacillati TaxID=1783272 RepID=UPI001C6F3552|nr:MULTISPECIES: 3-hydroxyacyl-CoA dehydrogenase [Terrabacteria group]MBW9212219.1 3-hydroxyacyl-CoA dehydrogenase [Trueperella sp. zg.1013]
MNWKNVTIAGGGVLGSQIALQVAYSGYKTTIWLRSEDSITRTKPKLERYRDLYIADLESMKDGKHYFPGLSRQKKLSVSEMDALIENFKKAYQNIVLTTDWQEGFADADFIIEAIAENVEEKKDFYTKLNDYTKNDVVIATNSSTLLPSQFKSCIKNKENYLALHFANHIWRQNTAEIMGHDETDKNSFDAVVDFAQSIHMVPLKLFKEQPGYLLNSMLVPFLSAAQQLLADGVGNVEDIDKAWTLGTGSPLGPFRILDIVGLQTAYNIQMMKPSASDPQTPAGRVATMLKAYLDAGKTGVNAKEGFYSYKEEGK